MNDFTFYSPTKYIFRRGAADDTGRELSSSGCRNVLIVYGGSSAVKNGLLDKVRTSLAAAGLDYRELSGVRPNPEVTQVREGIRILRESSCDSLLAVGGGSVIDCAKAIAAGACYDGDVWDFFCGRAKINAALPVSAVLTLPAAGSEGSSSCVISNDEAVAKRGASSDLIRPRIAFMDPESTYTLPPYQTAAGVTDMLAHICERYFSGQAPVAVTDAIATSLVRTLVEAAPAALANPAGYSARATIMWAGTLAHNDLAGCGRAASISQRAGGWESHALEHELSAVDPRIAHGAGLAVIMPAWMRHVWSEDPSRFASFGREVFGIAPEDYSKEAYSAAALKTIESLQSFFVNMGMPSSLKEFGTTQADIERMLDGLEKSKGRRFGAFKSLTREDARAIYLDALTEHC